MTYNKMNQDKSISYQFFLNCYFKMVYQNKIAISRFLTNLKYHQTRLTKFYIKSSRIIKSFTQKDSSIFVVTFSIRKVLQAKYSIL